MHDIEIFETKLKTDSESAPMGPPAPEPFLAEGSLQNAERYADTFDPAAQGNRNSTAYGHAARLREKFPLTKGQVLQIMEKWNQTKCSPPLKPTELQQAVEDAFKYAQKPAGSGFNPTRTSKGAITLNAFTTDAEDEFREYTPLSNYRLPPFPLDALPTGLAMYVKSISECLQVPEDMAGMLVLATLSVASCGRYVVHPRNGWMETTNLYVTVVMPSASRKSAVFRFVTEPIRAYEKNLYEAKKSEIEKNRSDFAVLEQRKQDLEKKVAKKGALRGELDRVIEEIAGFEHLYEPTLIVSDVTGQAAEKLLAQNDGRLGIFSPEGGIFAIFGGRFSDKPVNDVFLKGHDGDPFRSGRISREGDDVERPILTMGLTIQPTIIEHLDHKRLLQDSGMLARFLYSYPEQYHARETFDTPSLPDHVQETYGRVIREIFQRSYLLTEPEIIPLSSEAVEIFGPYYESFDGRLRMGGDLYPIEAWGGKLRGHVLRIAANLELAEWIQTDRSRALEIRGETIARAIRIGNYLIPHARKTLGLLRINGVYHVAAKIEKWLITEEINEVSKRDLYDKLKGSADVSRVDDLNEPLRILYEHGYIRRKPQEKKRGRPSEIYIVNPEIYSQK